MDIEKIKKQLKNLTPKQKLDFLNPLFEEEKDKEKKKELNLLIKKSQSEQLILDSEIKNFEQKIKISENKEQEISSLENIIQESVEENPNLAKDQKPMELYGTENLKPNLLYGANNIEKNINYLSPQEREKEQYKAQPEALNVNRSFHDINLDESKRLEKEKKKYETGS